MESAVLRLINSTELPTHNRWRYRVPCEERKVRSYVMWRCRHRNKQKVMSTTRSACTEKTAVHFSTKESAQVSQSILPQVSQNKHFHRQMPIQKDASAIEERRSKIGAKRGKMKHIHSSAGWKMKFTYWYSLRNEPRAAIGFSCWWSTISQPSQVIQQLSGG